MEDQNDSQDQEEEVDQLSALINQIEQSEKTTEIIDWMTKISQPEFGLIQSMIEAFINHLGSKQYDLANKILRSIRKLNEYIPESILIQMVEDEQFPGAICQYIVDTDIYNMIGDGFVLLVEIFKTKNFNMVSNEKFVTKILSDFEYIQDEEVFNSIVEILVSVSNEQKSPQDNIIIKICSKHKNTRFFSESLAQLINKGNENRIQKSLKFVRDTYSVVQEGFFYMNDFKVILSVCLREITNTQDENLRISYLETLQILVQSNDYKKQNHRKQDIVGVCKEINIFPNVSQKAKEIAFSIEQNLQSLY